MYNQKDRNLIVAYILWFALGTFGFHRLYLKRYFSGFVMLVLGFTGYSTAIFLVGYPVLFVVGIWWLIDAFLTHKIYDELENQPIIID